jgi:sigma-B regulation protein RsbU (phosphoserine phosphatase)
MSSVPRVPQRTNLADLLRERSVQIIERWKHRVDIALTDGGLTTAELLDHMPAFLDELERSARALSKRLAPAGAMSASWVSPEHGRWRLRHGFDVDEVIREYGLLGDVILELCAESAFVPTIAETQLLHGRLFGGASAAIAAYVQRRDDELRRLASQHLAFIAHEIRNPLGMARPPRRAATRSTSCAVA